MGPRRHHHFPEILAKQAYLFSYQCPSTSEKKNHRDGSLSSYQARAIYTEIWNSLMSTPRLMFVFHDKCPPNVKPPGSRNFWSARCRWHFQFSPIGGATLWKGTVHLCRSWSQARESQVKVLKHEQNVPRLKIHATNEWTERTGCPPGRGASLASKVPFDFK